MPAPKEHRPKRERDAKPGRKRATSLRTPTELARFKKIYLTNGHNGTQAALAIGHSPRSARARAYELVRMLRASGELQAEAQRVAEEAHIDTVRTLREVSRIAFCDPGRIFDQDGMLLPLDLVDDDTRAAISSVELDEEGRPVKVKFWSKVEALSAAMKHLGLFEKHNTQRRENLAIQINLVGAPEPVMGQPREVGVQATLVEPKKPNGHANGHKNGSHE